MNLERIRNASQSQRLRAWAGFCLVEFLAYKLTIMTLLWHEVNKNYATISPIKVHVYKFCFTLMCFAVRWVRLSCEIRTNGCQWVWVVDRDCDDCDLRGRWTPIQLTIRLCFMYRRHLGLGFIGLQWGRRLCFGLEIYTMCIQNVLLCNVGHIWVISWWLFCRNDAFVNGLSVT